MAQQDNRGRFLPGNKMGTGNPIVKKQAEYRRQFHAAVTPDMMRQVALAMYRLALDGDVQAARLVADYTLGKPIPAVEAEEGQPTVPGALVINLIAPNAPPR